MKDFIPDAAFNPRDEPLGDKRWFYKALYQFHETVWTGPEPEIYSPHTRTEELAIQEAILTGVLAPRNGIEQLFFLQIDRPRPRKDWPRKWVTCARCGSDWNLPGYPAGKVNRFTAEINCHQLIDKAGIVWFWPNLCQPCADLREAKRKKPKLPAPPALRAQKNNAKRPTPHS